MKKSIAILLLAWTIPLAAPAGAEEAMMQLAVSRALHEMTDCAAYFAIASRGLAKSDTLATRAAAKRYEKFSDEAIVFAVMIANMRGDTREAVTASLKLAIDEMLARIGNDYSNFKLLIDDYREPCQKALENPSKRLDHWIEQGER